MNLPKDTVNYMKRIVFCFAASLLFFSCGGKKTEKEPVINPLWGMWVQQEPVMESKCEMMFTEDYKGFVFMADTFYCKMAWRQDSLLRIYFVNTADTVTPPTLRKFRMAINEDTLLLKETAAEGGESLTQKYIRFKE